MRILITGGTGSLGRALTRYYLNKTGHRVIIFSRDEYKQAAMREQFPSPDVDFFLGDVRDADRVRLAFEARPDVVIHAAALKRVDSIGHDPDESFKTNVEGTRHVLQAARGLVRKVLLISSDKACYPINAYGVSKAMAEHLTTSFNVYSYPQGTISSVLRYGNVLASRGSVLELWRKQEVPRITDVGMTRFLLTLPQACAYIDWTLLTMHGGEIFVPQLPTATIVELLGAARPSTGRVEVTGLRPGGEKLHETLMTVEENARASYVGGGLYVIIPTMHPWIEKHPLAEPATGHTPAAWVSNKEPRVSPENLAEMVRTALED